MQSRETLEYLRRKAALLPKSPGVYIMENACGKVIYVGKSRALKNRVSQYFHGSHDLKTTKMASNVNDFRYITCDTEMEALVMENNLIKQYNPKYNILLKDSKSYPYIRITDGEYPRVVLSRRRDEKGMFFGPYSGAGVVYSVISTLERVLGLPSCKRKFPEDIGRGRPCVYRQIGRCCGVCAGDVSAAEYAELIGCAVQFLKGNTDAVEKSLYDRMLRASDEERYEEAARCRDALTSLKKLGQTQKTQLPRDTDCDVVAFASHEGCDCAAVLYIRGGKICDSEYFTFGADEITGADNAQSMADSTENMTGETGGEKSMADGTGGEDKTASAGTVPDGDIGENGADSDDGGDEESVEETPMSAFIVGLYRGREYIPPEILLSFDMPEGEKNLIGAYLGERAGHKVTLRTPKRGEARSLCLMAQRDAVRHSETRRKRDEDDERVLVRLASLLSLEVVPQRIEAYDISNLGSEHITAGMIVADGGKLRKSDYRVFRIKGQDAPDDYSAMRQTLMRRIAHIGDGEDTSLSAEPDLILLDGGAGHVGVVRELFRDADCHIPVFGMVKDEHHKTRTLVSDTDEVSIAREAEVFRFIYKLQEEVHRFTVSRMSAAKRKTLKTSSLEKISGIGPVKAKKLMSHFKTLSALKEASAEEISAVSGISRADAEAVFAFFNKNSGGK